MSGSGDRYLLPAGLTDVLPPSAENEAFVVETLMATLSVSGFERVKPPLLEFEDTLLSGAGADVAQQSFRLMDPKSQKMLALRADITPQVARIASSRMAQAPRPLRLCYSGQVLQVQGSQLRPGRQIGQVGAELIGSAASAADAEVLLLAGDSLAAIGVPDISIDINLPTLVTICARELGFSDAKTERLKHLLDRKDAAAVSREAGEHGSTFLGLLRASGPVKKALGALGRLQLPDVAAELVARLQEVLSLIEAANPDLLITVDPVEHRGFEYHEGISFIVFSRAVRGELGRGGRYRSAAGSEGQTGEPCTGFSLFMDTVLQAVPSKKDSRRIFVPFGVNADVGRQLRASGWTTVAGLTVIPDIPAEAKRMRCSHFWRDGKITQGE